MGWWMFKTLMLLKPSLHICKHMYLWVCTHMCSHVWESQKTASGVVLLRCHPPHSISSTRAMSPSTSIISAATMPGLQHWYKGLNPRSSVDAETHSAREVSARGHWDLSSLKNGLLTWTNRMGWSYVLTSFCRYHWHGWWREAGWNRAWRAQTKNGSATAADMAADHSEEMEGADSHVLNLWLALCSPPLTPSRKTSRSRCRTEACVPWRDKVPSGCCFLLLVSECCVSRLNKWGFSLSPPSQVLFRLHLYPGRLFHFQLWQQNA